MDIGASTGGFTDCMLQNGAQRVYSIDVGYGQLAWSLRNDERVVSMEKTNFRYLTPDDIPDTPDFASVDVSFISLSKILPPAHAIIKDGAYMVCLIKTVQAYADVLHGHLQQRVGASVSLPWAGFPTLYD